MTSPSEPASVSERLAAVARTDARPGRDRRAAAAERRRVPRDVVVHRQRPRHSSSGAIRPVVPGCPVRCDCEADAMRACRRAGSRGARSPRRRRRRATRHGRAGDGRVSGRDTRPPDPPRRASSRAHASASSTTSAASSPDCTRSTPARSRAPSRHRRARAVLDDVPTDRRHQPDVRARPTRG